jgi:hypothetical protein
LIIPTPVHQSLFTKVEQHKLRVYNRNNLGLHLQVNEPTTFATTKKVKFYCEKKRLVKRASGAVKRDRKTEISDETTEMLQALVNTRWFKYDRD